jgi:hypothetical protein
MIYARMYQPPPGRVYSHTVCDVCKTRLPPGSMSECTDITIRAQTGGLYPEADCRNTEEIDCCEDCWRTRVRPAIEALGAKFREHPSNETSESWPIGDET